MDAHPVDPRQVILGRRRTGIFESLFHKKPRRYIFASHKAGVVLSSHVRHAIESLGLPTISQCLEWDGAWDPVLHTFVCLELSAAPPDENDPTHLPHTLSAVSLKDLAYVVLLERHPLAMVVSGFEYHRSGQEGDVYDEATYRLGAAAAASHYDHSALAAHRLHHRAYAAFLSSLSYEEGLRAEMERALLPASDQQVGSNGYVAKMRACRAALSRRLRRPDDNATAEASAEPPTADAICLDELIAPEKRAAALSRPQPRARVAAGAMYGS